MNATLLDAYGSVNHLVHMRVILVAILLLAFVPERISRAAVATSITPTTGTGNLGTTITPAGNLYDITGGTRPGGGPNLFHSFGNFSVGAGDIANFLNTPVNGSLPFTSNILGRVTGGNVSNIFGTIQTTNFGKANLFLMNPAGFLFGPNATINVGGMMTFTTADYMRLADGGRFNANPNGMPPDTLTTAPVAAFGFLGSNPAAINFEGGQLTVASGTGIMLVGGDINLAADPVTGTPSGITAHGRPIQLTSVAGPGEVAADIGVPAPGMALGTITLGQGTILDTTGDSSVGDGSGGAISIRGGQLVATGATILTSPAFGSTGQGGTVTITASDTASLTDGSLITTSSSSPNGDAGAVSITASHVILQDSVIFAEYAGDGTTAGNGGAVTLTSTDSIAITQSGILTDFADSNGNGGAVHITAPTIALEDALLLTGNPLSTVNVAGSGGAVTLTGTISVSLTRSGIDTSTSFTTGNSGPITITAPTITISDVGVLGTSIDTSTHSFNVPSAGNGGDIQITGTNVTFSNSATVKSIADSSGSFSKGGTIQINGTENLLLDSGTLVQTTTTSQATTGGIHLASNHVTITGQSFLSSETLGLGGGGPITITGRESIALGSGSVISATSAPGSGVQSGPAGQIELDTQQLTITGGSIVRSQTFGTGLGGTITAQGIAGPAQSIVINGPGSGIFTSTSGTGAGGDIHLSANSVTLRNGAQLTSSSTGAGNAGNIMINAGNQFTMTNASVTTEANQSSGGAIKISTSPNGTVELTNSKISASVLDGTGGGGSVNIDPQFVILQNSQILAQAVQGPGGNIFITTNLLLQDANSVISASSKFGQNGTITIQSPINPAGGKIIPLSQKPLIATALLSQRCAALAGGGYSSFTVAGRDSLPAEPGSWLSSPLAALSAAKGLEARGQGQEAGGDGERLVASDQGREDMTLGTGQGPAASGEGEALRADERREARGERETPILSLRQIAPPGFLTRAFAVESSAGCTL